MDWQTYLIIFLGLAGYVSLKSFILSKRSFATQVKLIVESREYGGEADPNQPKEFEFLCKTVRFPVDPVPGMELEILADGHTAEIFRVMVYEGGFSVYCRYRCRLLEDDVTTTVATLKELGWRKDHSRY